MDLELEGKVALVTGSYRGTGAGIARVLAAEGATVLVHGLEPGQADDTVARDHRGATGAATRSSVTCARRTARPRSWPTCATTVERVDIVINNYGVADGTDWDSSDTESWHGSYDTNVVSAVRVTQAFLPDMRAARWGRVVFVSTVGATRPGDRIPEYYAAKSACRRSR